MAAVLRQLVGDLCGDFGGALQCCFVCGVSPYGAASGNRQLRQDRDIVALMPILFFSLLIFLYLRYTVLCDTFEQCSPIVALPHRLRVSRRPFWQPAAAIAAATAANTLESKPAAESSALKQNNFSLRDATHLARLLQRRHAFVQHAGAAQRLAVHAGQVLEP